MPYKIQSFSEQAEARLGTRDLTLHCGDPGWRGLGQWVKVPMERENVSVMETVLDLGLCLGFGKRLQGPCSDGRRWEGRCDLQHTHLHPSCRQREQCRCGRTAAHPLAPTGRQQPWWVGARATPPEGHPVPGGSGHGPGSPELRSIGSQFPDEQPQKDSREGRTHPGLLAPLPTPHPGMCTCRAEARPLPILCVFKYKYKGLKLSDEETRAVTRCLGRVSRSPSSFWTWASCPSERP